MSSKLLAPKNWALRARLLTARVLVLFAVCAAIAAVTQVAVYHMLTRRLDARLEECLVRAEVIFGAPIPPAWHFRNHAADAVRPGPDFLDAPGQPVGLLGAAVVDGRAVDVGVLAANGTTAWDTEPVPVSALAEKQLAAPDIGPEPATRVLDGLGRYRLVAGKSRLSGTPLVVGVSMSAVDQAFRANWIFLAWVIAAALAIAVLTEVVILKRALAPLNRVAATAGEISALPLDGGEIHLPVRVAAQDANPNTEVGRVGMALNTMLDHFADTLAVRQATERRLRQFIADTSHELRTPLAAIRGYTEFVKRHREVFPPDVAHAISRVESQSARMNDLVEDLLLLAELDGGGPRHSEHVDLSKMCAELVRDAHANSPAHKWTLDMPPDPVIVTGDESDLYKVVCNLLANASAHTPAGTAVSIEISVDSRDALIRVKDNGPGIPAELQPEVFERFVRGDASRSLGGGRSTGLGLPIVLAVVRAHRGTVELFSQPGNTEFVVRLPR